MMTNEQRYLYDLQGYLHLKNVLSTEELRAAQQAAERYIKTPPEDLPDGFGIDGKRCLHGFAFDKALERLCLHPSSWSIITELTNQRPRLGSGTLLVNLPNDGTSEPLRLHCARDDFGWESVRYEVRSGRIFCDDIVVFPYLSDVYSGDGGLLLVPGSHKSNFDRPPELFNNGVIESLETLPAGVVNVTPKAGDFVIMNEALTHGALPWSSKDRMRMMLVLRYSLQYRKNSGLPDAITSRLSSETLELTAIASYKDIKEIVANGVEASGDG
jgi:hypothetical protein